MIGSVTTGKPRLRLRPAVWILFDGALYNR